MIYGTWRRGPGRRQQRGEGCSRRGLGRSESGGLDFMCGELFRVDLFFMRACACLVLNVFVILILIICLSPLTIIIVTTNTATAAATAATIIVVVLQISYTT